MIGASWALIKKDLLIYLKSPQHWLACALFAVTVLLVLHFALPVLETMLSQNELGTSARPENTAAGVYWVVFLLSGVLALSHTAEIENQDRCYEALCTAPFSSQAWLLAKITGNFLYIGALQVLAVPLFGLFFETSVVSNFWSFLQILLLSNLGFSTVGTLISTITAMQRLHTVLLSILLLPLCMPLLIASIKLTQSLPNFEVSNASPAVGHWWRLLIAYDLIFLGLAVLVFNSLLEPE